MNETPAAIDRRVVEQPLQRTLPAPRDAFIDLSGLLGDVNVDRACACQRDNGVKFPRGDRPQRVRRETNQRPLKPRHGAAARLD
jgi:hypothetical protein